MAPPRAVARTPRGLFALLLGTPHRYPGRDHRQSSASPREAVRRWPSGKRQAEPADEPGLPWLRTAQRSWTLGRFRYSPWPRCLSGQRECVDDPRHRGPRHTADGGSLDRARLAPEFHGTILTSKRHVLASYWRHFSDLRKSVRAGPVSTALCGCGTSLGEKVSRPQTGNPDADLVHARPGRCRCWSPCSVRSLPFECREGGWKDRGVTASRGAATSAELPSPRSAEGRWCRRGRAAWQRWPGPGSRRAGSVPRCSSPP